MDAAAARCVRLTVPERRVARRSRGCGVTLAF
jgi:hypothetical protein